MTLNYENQAKRYLQQAKEEYDAKDLRQAAEKGWGAASQMVKAVANRRGWMHHHHNQLEEAIGRLIEESQDPELGTCFSSAAYLHQNFYEGKLGAFAVGLYIGQVEILVEKLEKL